jgi:hypothetical protein
MLVLGSHIHRFLLQTCLSSFPNITSHQILNSLATRSVLPDPLTQLPKRTSLRRAQDARWTDLDDFALVEDGNAVEIEDRFDAVGDRNDSVACKARPDQTLEEGVGFVI